MKWIKPSLEAGGWIKSSLGVKKIERKGDNEYEKNAVFTDNGWFNDFL